MYIRFGELPKDGRSVNFFKASYDQQDLGIYSDDVRENGVSVFAMADGKPLLANLELAKSLHARVGAKAYIVGGVEVGTGEDEEPLLSDVFIVSGYNYSKKDMYDHIIDYLKANYELIGGAVREDYGSRENKPFIGISYTETKRNIKTGEIINYWDHYGEPGYENLKPYHTIMCNGLEFKEEKE